MAVKEKMKVEIWSDIMCPFCYIGKRKFEQALDVFPHRDNIDVIWRSYQLDPTISYEPGRDLYSYLAERKGKTLEWSKSVHQHLTDTAREVGLTYHFDKAIIANSFDAHRLIQLAKKYGKGDAAEERLFSAYFTEGRNVSDHDTLISLGVEIGLDRDEIKKVLDSDAYANDVTHDGIEAQQLGAQGVPFFVMDRKYGVAGAQPVDAFSQTLDKSYSEWEKEHPAITIETLAGEVCTPDGECK
jgi:protein disulfide-isomerase